jgi:hypothetical protein
MAYANIFVRKAFRSAKTIAQKHNLELTLKRRAKAIAVRAYKMKNDPVALLKEESDRAKRTRINNRANDPIALSLKDRTKQLLAMQRLREKGEDVYAAFMREKDRRKHQKKRDADPVAYALFQREKSKRQRVREKLRDPEALKAQDKRKRDKARWAHGKNREKDAAEVYALIGAAIPRGIPDDVRQDIGSALIIKVMEGKVSATDVRRAVQDFISAHYKMFDGFKTSSLDEVIPGTDSLRRIDTVASDDPHF